MAPIAPIGATLSYSSGGLFGPWNNGATATMTCPFGQTVIGSATASCNNGVWSTLGTCSSSSGNGTFGVTLMPHGNSSLPCYFGVLEPPYGNVSYTYNAPPYPSGTIATLRCDAGYAVMGASTSTCAGVTISTCSGNGQFLPAVLGPCTSTSPNVPTPGLTCPALLAVGGTISYSSPGPPYADGSTATLFCDLGYKLSGLPTVVTFSKTSNSSGFPPGTTAALRCTMGRYIVGPSFATCSHGAFRPILGKCADGREDAHPGVCLPLRPPANGRITYIQSGKLDNFEVGTTALLYCLESFAVTGQATVVCSKDGWQPSSGLGECESTTRKL
ncbi:sushi domain protein [Necator americanus]|uniref:Sushi domain protein n=1 Tax=Necator americanus TaxID=51031 RepID=W2TRZ4_NECAM|nr:sushi domain protein [Necator americanus]ETN83886.1 sushi domain protein [Necator americanus]